MAAITCEHGGREGSTPTAGRLAVALALMAGCGGTGEAPNEVPPTAGWTVVAASGTEAPLEAGPFLPLHTSGDRIVDAAGRQVILRGLQHHALQDVDYIGREVAPADYAQIASWGFTVLRVAISWSRIEPERGTYDPAYVAEIRAAMDLARDAGLSVILEWHQDLWGRCSQAPGTPLRMNANGAPDWTCPPGYEPSALGHFALFDRLWQDQDGLQSAFLDAWAFVLGALGTHPALLGCEVMNEPQGATVSPALEKDVLFPAYRKLVPALRERGAPGLLFLDAPALRNETFELYAEPLDDAGIDVVYAPHLYSGWLQLYIIGASVPPEQKALDFQRAAEQAAALHLPLWNGEWGVNLLLPDATLDLRTHATLEDTYRIGSSYWAFNRAVPGQGDASISGAQSLLNTDRSVRKDALDVLSRPYPIQTPGVLTGIAWGADTRRLRVGLDVDAAIAQPLVLYAPERHLGTRVCLTVEGLGGFTWNTLSTGERILVRFDTAGAHVVTVAPCHGLTP